MKAPAAVTANRNISPMLFANQRKELAKINCFLHYVLNAAECCFFLSVRVSKAGSLKKKKKNAPLLLLEVFPLMWRQISLAILAAVA